PFWSLFGVTPLTTHIEPSFPHEGPPTTSITGFTGFSSSLFVRNDDHWQLTDNFSWSHSKHTIKMGSNFARHGINLWPPTTVAGTVSFSNTSQGPTTTYGVSDVLLGLPTSTSLRPNPIKYYISTINWHSYLQDDYKMNSRLTLNLGLRWELNLPPR